MEAKKISFGFSKVTKKSNILPVKTSIAAAKEEAKKVELIECLEGKEIKLVDGGKPEEAPLVIQMVTNQKTSTALASLLKRRAVLLGEDEKPDDSEPQTITEVTVNDSDNLEERAARELLASVQANNSEGLEENKLVLPAVKADELPLDGAKEATLDDYDSIPIQQFGLAMLRGMGWVDPPPKKKGQGPVVDDAPFLRPKGMGLGADKALKPKALLVQPEKNEVLEIKKQAYVRILGGKLKDQYGQVEGFDDHAGRVIVKMAIGGAKEAFNEFLCQPVSSKEYSQYGKCINTAKYEEFKKLENKHGQIIVKREKSADRDQREDRDEDREQRQRLSRDDERRRYKEEERKPYRLDRGHKDADDRPERRRDKGDSRGSSSSTSTSTYRASRTEERTDRRRDTEDKRSIREEDRETKSNKCEDHRQRSSDDEADDTGESTESDSDSAYERKKHKSSNKSKKKKSKKAKSKSSRRKASNVQSNSDESSDEYRRHSSSKHKKKTKKSKHARSRTRSRSRSRAGRAR
ncbi:uncharacterized protein Dwil_GK13859 [Drosophila willistoni]|uniref:Spp2/MOS2 G-patch domain-containing protein n=1 Tax=Drosophila willistoni TaxID=7260 RepID=B4NJH7_DROWI|nr:G-patch domain and KOW motifs-containing protein [Drosophila willistoni]EDW83901.1 uncharacterized protein Dwil_GK13859 [Drosophila willistoni]